MARQAQAPKPPFRDWNTERSQREIVRLERALQQTTPQAITGDIESSLPKGAADALRELFLVRNRLAHRFLLETTQADGYKLGTKAELIEIGNRFMDSLELLMTTEALRLQPYEGDVPPHWEGIASQITERVFTGQPIPRDPKDQ